MMAHRDDPFRETERAFSQNIAFPSVKIPSPHWYFPPTIAALCEERHAAVVVSQPEVYIPKFLKKLQISSQDFTMKCL
jgi:hypothetical protein